MPIPELNSEGLLPKGLFERDLPEMRVRFGAFSGSDRRPKLFARLEELLRVMRITGLFEELIIDGSFVTSKEQPNDVDLIAVLRPGHNFERDLPMSEYALVSRTFFVGGSGLMWWLRNVPASCIEHMLNSSAECVKHQS